MGQINGIPIVGKRRISKLLVVYISNVGGRGVQVDIRILNGCITTA
jgi:hypothetical protein